VRKPKKTPADLHAAACRLIEAMELIVREAQTAEWKNFPMNYAQDVIEETRGAL
jgi:hypothetical protein